MDIADIETSTTVGACSSSHQLLKKDIVAKGDVYDTVDFGEDLQIAVKLFSSSGEPIQDDTLSRFRFLNFLLDNLDNNIIADQSTWLDNISNSLHEFSVEGARD